jgi:hypothetical protein
LDPHPPGSVIFSECSLQGVDPLLCTAFCFHGWR